MSKTSIIIPNWNGKNFLVDCLKSLHRIKNQNFNIIVVDNGSSDDSVYFINKNFPKVLVIKNKENLGFATACNIGIKKAIKIGSEYFLLLNNDTIVTDDFLDKMLSVFKNKKVGIVGCKINYESEPKKIWFAGGDFIKWRVSGKHINWMKNDNDNIRGVVNSDFITGCCILIKKEVINSIGYFYEPSFLTVEDLEFCYLTKRAGWKIKVNLDAKIYHKVSFSRQGEFSFSNGYYGTRNRLFFAFKYKELYIGGLILLFFILPIRILQWIFYKKFEMIKGTLFGIKDFFIGKKGKKNKNHF